MSQPEVETKSPIDGVIAELVQLVGWATSQPSRVGYFASLYLRVTRAIRSRIGTCYFDDDARLESLDAAFAARYLSAVTQFRSRDPGLPAAWAVAFGAVDREDLLVVQHLLLAMNPHVNIDLAITAARTCPGATIAALHDDFMRINAILAEVVPMVIAELGTVSPLMHLLSDLAAPGEETLIGFSLDVARDAAWRMAEQLAALSVDAQEARIRAENGPIALLSGTIASPGPIAEAVIALVREEEVKDVRQIITILNAPQEGAPLTATPARALPVTAAEPPNRVYYCTIAPGVWTGTFSFEVTSWRRLWTSPMSLKNKLLASAMAVFQGLFGDTTISSEIVAHPASGSAGMATNDIRIFKSWFPLWHSYETYTLFPDGSRVGVDAQVGFGPVPFLLREHDVYPAAVSEGGMRNVYHIKLLGTEFLGDYRVQADHQVVQSRLFNEWASAREVLVKQFGPASATH